MLRDGLRLLNEWARGAADDQIPVNEYQKLAARRHLEDLKKAHQNGLFFDEESAVHGIEFFDRFLCHSKGEWAGQPFELQPWQAFIVGSIFGWHWKESGLRRFRTCYVELPRKNGKSTLAAGVGLYLLFPDGEPGAEIYSAATKKEQARIVFSEAVRMVRASPHLSSRINIFRDNLHIVETASKFEPLGADEDTLDGLNVHGAIIDELHAHKNRGVYDILDTATGSRRQPLIFTITTAGYDRNTICWELHGYAEKLLRGIIRDETFFAFVACMDSGDDWTSEEAWRKCNPNYGLSVKPDDMRVQCQRAKESPAAQNTFRRLRLNEWTEQYERWIDIAAWDECAGPVDITELEGKECWGGLDLSSTKDITALTLVFDVDGIIKVVPYFWVPKENIIARAKNDRVPYDIWCNQGFIEATDGNVVDQDAIEKKILELREVFDIKEIAFDRWNATQLTTRLGGENVKVVPFGQGFSSMSAPTKELDKLVTSRKVHHGGNPVLRWMASNVAVKQDPAGNIKPAKDKSSEKIDGIVALIMGLGARMLSPDGDAFVYNNTGIFFG